MRRAAPSSGIVQHPATSCNIRRGAFFWEGRLRCFDCRQGVLTSVRSNDTPLAFVISLAGCSSFKQSSAVQLQQVTIGKNLTFDLTIKVSAHQPPSGDSSEKIDLNKQLITNETATIFCRVLSFDGTPHEMVTF